MPSALVQPDALLADGFNVSGGFKFADESPAHGAMADSLAVETGAIPFGAERTLKSAI